MVLEQIKKNGVKLVFLANDAMQNTTKRIQDKTSFYGVKLNQDFTSEELNNAIGTDNRKAIGITDSNFAKLIIRELEQ